jgi:hypothetical protein
MRKQRTSSVGRVITVLAVVLSLCWVSEVSAQQAVSPNYSVDQTQFNAGSQQDMCTATYCADGTAGDLTVGSGKSTNYQAQTGSQTTDEPLLEVGVTQTDKDMGVLTTSAPGKVSAQVSVRSYLSNGYVMEITGRSPHYGGHYITSMSTSDTSNPGTEQFGINLVDNSSPDIGADPVQVPDDDFSFGTVASYYNTADVFKYVEGDVVAQSATSSGQTNYTVSMIVNISNVTPGGQYSGEFSAVVVPVY